MKHSLRSMTAHLSLSYKLQNKEHIRQTDAQILLQFSPSEPYIGGSANGLH